VDAHRAALAALPADAADRGRVAGNLGATLWERWWLGDDEADLRAAADLLRTANASVPAGSPARPLLRNSLGLALRDIHEAHGSPDVLAAATESFREACAEGLVLDITWALHAADNWGRWAAARTAWPEAAEAYEFGLSAVRRGFGRQLSRPDKETWLRLTANLPSRAAVALLAAGSAKDAVTALDAGRALLLREALDADAADLQRLRDDGRPELAELYRARAGVLERLSRGVERLPSGSPRG
jgi:hypothetical protein